MGFTEKKKKITGSSHLYPSPNPHQGDGDDRPVVTLVVHSSMLRCHLANVMAFHASSVSKKTSCDKVANLASVCQKKKKVIPADSGPKKTWLARRDGPTLKRLIKMSSTASKEPNKMSPDMVTQWLHSIWKLSQNTQYCCLHNTPTQGPVRESMAVTTVANRSPQ